MSSWLSPPSRAASVAPRADAPLGYYRFPALSGDLLVFTAEGDLWKTTVNGGVPERLTAHPGQETDAAVSPDGKWVAFTGTYEGPEEAYVLPLEGGPPRRLTWDGGPVSVVAWTPDAKVLISTRRYSTLPNEMLIALDPVSGAQTAVPLAQASDGIYAADGTLYFTRLPFQGSQTRRYKGGTAQQLWRLAPGAPEAVPVTGDFPGTSKRPMIWKDRLYFLSDRDGTMNVWSMALAGGASPSTRATPTTRLRARRCPPGASRTSTAPTSASTTSPPTPTASCRSDWCRTSTTCAIAG